MTTQRVKKLAPLLPAALALLAFALVHVRLADERRAASAFRNFSLRLNQKRLLPTQESIEQAVSLSPENAYYLACRGLLHARMSGTEFDAASFLSKSFALGEERAQQLGAAARYYERSLALNPLDDGNYHNLGWLYTYLGEREQALRCFRKAVSLDSSIALYHVSLGLLHERNGENEEAHREYELAVRLSPAILDSLFFRDLRERSRAVADRVVAGSISHLEAQLGQGRSTILQARLGKLYLYVNSLDQASAMLREVVTAQPSLPRPWHNLGAVYEAQGNEWAMRNAYQKAVFLDSGDALAWFKLGSMHDRRDNKQAAISAYVQAVRSWTNTRSEHAVRVARIYRTSVVHDDVVPNGFLSYCTPFLDVAAICRRLAELFEEMGDAGLSNYYRELSAELAP